MRHVFKVNQRIKRGVLRGTVLEVLKAQGFSGVHDPFVCRACRRGDGSAHTPATPVQYLVRMDNGAKVMGTGYQFQPVKRAAK